jgi:hypothetical protein
MATKADIVGKIAFLRCNHHPRPCNACMAPVAVKVDRAGVEAIKVVAKHLESGRRQSSYTPITWTQAMNIMLSLRAMRKDKDEDVPE